MLLSYADESGDDGLQGSRSYTVACVMVDAEKWLAAHDALLAYRSFLRTSFGVPARAELKANFLLHGGGALRALGLPVEVRRRIYRGAMRMSPKAGIDVFAVVIDKRSCDDVRHGRRLPSEVAWERVLQRLERRCHYESTHTLIIHDEGNGEMIRRQARRARRVGSAGSAFGTGYLKTPFHRLIDDPVPRDSSQSLFIQLADLCAYAAFSEVFPSTRGGRAFAAGMWGELGAARFSRVRNARYGDPTGIIVER